ncbi:hypothetical protein [Sandaracinobacteroides saxicola]|uniref:Uncharacterized protein n=1 Tax=Sandaracinobacteroides saxicola TaxID=2759707 RepID=A0A7G5IE93_9SPHN|nr:hypothetical protein [Sandaracinobacteroides saxicola]QMW21685.1 hypothetical protein H3309_09670 [Sandaracinobacteroides saxicola]
MTSVKTHAATAAIAATLIALPAAASSPAAWQAFQRKTATACIAAVTRAAAPKGAKPTATVSPTGTERFGVAIVTFKRGTATERHLCLMDKQTGATDIDPTPLADFITPPRK